MKKLLILMLVLGLASAASAAHSLGGATTISNTGDTTAIVTISADSTAAITSVVEDSEGADGMPTTGVTTIASVTKTDAAGEQATVTAYGSLDYAFTVSAKDTTEPFDSVATGVQFNVNLDIAGLGLAVDDTFVIYLYNEAYTSTFASHTVTVTPEPMTIALLGLGGLFLRRRK